MSQKVTFITQFTRTPSSIRDCSVVEFKEPSKVKESLSYAVDINTIYDNYCRTGKLPLNGQQPIYDENFVKLDTLIEAQQTVKDACQYFQSLPSNIRMQYGNSLEKFVAAIHSNDQFLYDSGVLLKKEVVKPTEILPKPSETPLTPSFEPVKSTVQPSTKDVSTEAATTA